MRSFDYSTICETAQALRISIVTGPFFAVPPGIGGAVERRWHGAAYELASRGHQVTMIGREADGVKSESSDRGVQVIRHTKYSQSGRLAKDLIVDLVYACRILRKVPRSDVIIANDFWFPILARIFRREKVFVNVARAPKGHLHLYRGATGFIVPSEAIKAGCMAEGIPEAKVSVLGNPIDVGTFTLPRVPRTYLPPYKLLYAGRIHPEKGIEILIGAVRILHESGEPVECKIVGPYRHDQGGGGENYQSTLQEMASGLPIKFCEPVFDRVALAEVYRSSDIFVYPSIAERGESFGVAPVEAMSTGAVPIVSGLACFDQFMLPGVGGTFDHRSSAPEISLSRAVMHLLKNTNLHEQARLASQSASRFSYGRVVEELLSLLNGQKS